MIFASEIEADAILAIPFQGIGDLLHINARSRVRGFVSQQSLYVLHGPGALG